MDEQTLNNTTTTTRRRYYMGAAIGAVMLVIIVILIIVLLADNSANNRCKLSKTIPDVRALLEDKKNIATPDNTTLANMIGYVYFYNDGYMPMVLTKLDVDDKKLTFTSDCALITWNYDSDKGQPHRPTSLKPSIIHLTTLDLLMGGDKFKTYSCDDWVHYDVSKRISCTTLSRIAFKAPPDEVHYERPLAELILESFELEMLGDPVKIKRGQFSKDPDPNSCTMIST